MDAAPTDLTRELRAKGYRLTPQRQFVLRAVSVLDHATPEAICEEVRRTAAGVNLSTVYRTLELLEDLGLVTHTHLGHGAQIYHTADQPAHVHLVCRGCGKIVEADVAAAEPLVERLTADYGFTTDVRHLAVFGHCSECSESERTARTARTAEADADRDGDGESEDETGGDAESWAGRRG
jgi:Fur family ferric uptake transcriptional regulator